MGCAACARDWKTRPMLCASRLLRSVSIQSSVKLESLTGSVRFLFSAPKAYTSSCPVPVSTPRWGPSAALALCRETLSVSALLLVDPSVFLGCPTGPSLKWSSFARQACSVCGHCADHTLSEGKLLSHAQVVRPAGMPTVAVCRTLPGSAENPARSAARRTHTALRLSGNLKTGFSYTCGCSFQGVLEKMKFYRK